MGANKISKHKEKSIRWKMFINLFVFVAFFTQPPQFMLPCLENNFTITIKSMHEIYELNTWIYAVNFVFHSLHENCSLSYEWCNRVSAVVMSDFHNSLLSHCNIVSKVNKMLLQMCSSENFQQNWTWASNEAFIIMPFVALILFVQHNRTNNSFCWFN